MADEIGTEAPKDPGRRAFLKGVVMGGIAGAGAMAGLGRAVDLLSPITPATAVTKTTGEAETTIELAGRIRKLQNEIRKLHESPKAYINSYRRPESLLNDALRVLWARHPSQSYTVLPWSNRSGNEELVFGDSRYKTPDGKVFQQKLLGVTTKWESYNDTEFQTLLENVPEGKNWQIDEFKSYEELSKSPRFGSFFDRYNDRYGAFSILIPRRIFLNEYLPKEHFLFIFSHSNRGYGWKQRNDQETTVFQTIPDLDGNREFIFVNIETKNPQFLKPIEAHCDQAAVFVTDNEGLILAKTIVNQVHRPSV